MKKLLIGLLLLNQSPTFASSNDYACQEVYKNRVEELTKSAKARRILRSSAVGSIGVIAGTGLIILTGGAGGAIILAMGFSGMTILGGVQMDEDKKLNQIDQTFKLQESFNKSFDELTVDIKKQRDKALAQLESELAKPEVRSQITEEHNRKSFRYGQEPESEEKAVKEYRMKANDKINSIFNDRINSFVHPMKASLNYAKENGLVPFSTTSATWAAALINNQELFCPDYKALKYKNAIKVIAEQL